MSSMAVSRQQMEPNERFPKTYLVVEVMRDKPGQLSEILEIFRKHQINMTHIESKLKSFAREGPAFHIDFEGSPQDEHVATMLSDLRWRCASLEVVEPRRVPWFPMHIRDLDLTRETLDGGSDLINEDHPGFHDEAYRSRREEIVSIANEFSYGRRIPRIDYTEEETTTWGAVYSRLSECTEKWGCKEQLRVMPQLEKECGYAPNNIPQLQDISEFLMEKTGFQLRPVQGLLSARDFLNALAFRTFFSTQYIRHHGNPFYTPEPDICHELLGHVPLFADMDFADFSQEIGLASLGASDEDVDRLATCYWFTVEFGLLREQGKVKAYGAGLLSSFGEMEWACDEAPSEECRAMGGITRSHPELTKPMLEPFDPFVTCRQAFPITTYQPLFFVADSMADAKRRMSQFCDSLQRPFHPQYNPLTHSVAPSKSVQREARTSTLQLQAEKQRAYFEGLEAAKTNTDEAHQHA
jgi:phenylalanine-4-hydroxylase